MERFEHVVVSRAHVLRLHGEFQDSSELSDAIVGCLTAETRCAVVNWSGITSINSVGFGGVIQCEFMIRKLGGYYRNCALTEESTPEAVLGLSRRRSL